MRQGNSGQESARSTFLAIALISVILPVPFFAAVSIFRLSGLPVYFAQLGLYAIFFGLAFWGLRAEGLRLDLTPRRWLAAFGVALLAWAAYALFLHFFGLQPLEDGLSRLAQIPAWKIGAQILSTWLFVGLGEELLFRAYFLPAFQRRLGLGEGRRALTAALFLSSLFFSLWHLPARFNALFAGDLSPFLLVLSLAILFVLGAAFAWLYLRSGNILLVGLVHGLMDFPLLGLNLQLSYLILLFAIAAVEISRRLRRANASAENV